MYGWITQLIQVVSANPQITTLLCIGGIQAVRAIERLSPEAKQKLARIVRWGVGQAARYALGTVLGEVGDRVIDQVVDDSQLAEVAKALVRRGIAVGVDKAIEEARLA